MEIWSVAKALEYAIGAFRLSGRAGNVVVNTNIPVDIYGYEDPGIGFGLISKTFMTV